MRADYLSGWTTSKTPSLKSGYFSDRLDDMQRRAVRFALETKTCGMFAEQGTGKTWISLALVEQLLTSDFAGLLIVMKNNKETTWLDQSKNLCGCEVTSDWERFKKIKGPRLFVAHYEQAIPIISRMVRFGNRWSCIIIDECQRLMKRSSKSSRAACRLRKLGVYRVGLSGTPLEQQPQDVWAQMRFINYEVFGDEWKHFDRRFLKRTGYGGYKREFKQEKWNKFIKLLAPWCIRLTKDYLGLEPLTHEIHKLDMNEDQARCYQQMKHERTVSLRTAEGGYIHAPLTISRDIRLSQIAGGFLQTERGYYWISNTKLYRVRQILKRAPHPVVVFCRYIPELLELERMLGLEGYKVKTYSGKTKNKAAVQREFQAGKVDVLICQERAGGVGLDLFKAKTLLIYSCSWSSIAFDQLISRVHRRGQEHPVTAHHLLVKKSIDIRKHKRIASKLQTAKKTLNHLERDTIMGEFAIAELADALGITAKDVRQKLRDNSIPKVEGRYLWKNEKDFKAVLKQLGSKADGKTEKAGKVAKADKKADKSGKKDKNAGSAPENKSAKKVGKSDKKADAKAEKSVKKVGKADKAEKNGKKKKKKKDR